MLTEPPDPFLAWVATLTAVAIGATILWAAGRRFK